MAVPLFSLGQMKSAERDPTKPAPGPADYAKMLVMLTGEMPRAEIDDIIFTCLKRVMWQSGPSWAPLVSANGSLMDESLGVVQVMEIVWRMLDGHALPDFFAAPPSVSAGPEIV